MIQNTQASENISKFKLISERTNFTDLEIFCIFFGLHISTIYNPFWDL